MTLNYDFHIHSIYSKDSILKPEIIIKVAKKKGLAGFAVTDHNTIVGALKTKLIARDSLEVIIGAEVETDKGEIIGLFLNEEIKSIEFIEVIEEIKDQGGISILPHPYRNKLCNPKRLLEMVDLVEGLNARTSKHLNYMAQSLAKDVGLQIIAGSDAHTPFEIGRVQTVLQEKDVTLNGIKNSLLNGEIYISGKESPCYLQHLSAGIGKFKKDGALGLAKSCLKKSLSLWNV